MIINRPAGAYIEKADGSVEPDLTDEATASRLGLNMDRGDRVAVKKKEGRTNADTRE